MKRAHLFVPLVNALVIGIFLLYFNAATFPHVGLDYRYFLARVVDTDLHYQVNGLSIQWYTPSFDGGMPAYPHPQNMQFSLVQALTALSDPWTAVQINYFVFSVAGCLGAYLFLRRNLKLGWQAATLGAVFFSANGFYLEHAAAGHLNHLGFPLLPFLLIGLLDAGIRPLWGGILCAGILSLLVYSASFYPIIYFLLSLGILLPLLFMLRPAMFNWKRLRATLLTGTALTLGLSASKLVAVASFMRFFPREMLDNFNIPWRTGLTGFVFNLLGVMFFAPLSWLLGWKMSAVREVLQTYSGAPIGLWELDLALTPLLWLALLAGIWLASAFVRRDGWPRQTSFWVGLALTLLACEITLEFTLARGVFYPVLRQLPVLRSLHVNSRFACAFILPLAMLGAVSIQAGLQCLANPKTRKIVFAGLNLLAILPVGAYLLLPMGRLQERIFDVSGLIQTDQRIHAGETFPIERITADVNEARGLQEQASSLTTLEMIFGYGNGKFGANLSIGPVRSMRDGYFNMTDPASLVYPEANGLTPWERIPAGQAQQLEDFVAHRQPDWKISSGQKAANIISLFSLIIVAGLPVYQRIFQRGTAA